jgi:hypothetical protein
MCFEWVIRCRTYGEISILTRNLRFIFGRPRRVGRVPFVAAKATAVHSFTRITPAVGGTGCGGVDTRNSQATGTAAATI